jgi:hypothetical protein
LARARRTYDVVILGTGFLGRLVGCMGAKAGLRVLRLRAANQSPIDTPPDLAPLDLTQVPAARAAAMRLGILMPLRDQLRNQPSLGQFASADGSAELFTWGEARDQQAVRCSAAPFADWCRRLSQAPPTNEPAEYPNLFVSGWWARLRRRTGLAGHLPTPRPSAPDALEAPYRVHPWTHAGAGAAFLDWTGWQHPSVLDQPLHTFLELAEARSGVDVHDSPFTHFEETRGGVESVVTERGERIGGNLLVWAASVDQLSLGSEKACAKMHSRWAKDADQTQTAVRVHGRIEAKYWPAFLPGPLLLDAGGVHLSVSRQGAFIELEAWLEAADQFPAVEQFLTDQLPLLPSIQWTLEPASHFARRARPDRLPPPLETPAKNVILAPDVLVHGIGLDAPFALAQQLADRLFAASA